jgi:2-oxoglutarate ferredoxin oxidoreductase subunit beta
MTTIELTRKDFVSDQTVRWCPGCGDYSILAQMQKVMPELGIPKEKIVFISGIGCSSRFPYYMNTYGIHSIHGRAPTLATGLAIANPELTIFVITGDGDGLSIGGNHLMHAIRRNVNLNIILFNNRIYGLTKGQYSPTSRQGAKTKSSPMGSIEQPINPISLALAAEASFIARSLDAHPQHLGVTLEAAARHQGVSFVEIYQNCVIFNPTEWVGIDDRRTRDENILYLEDGKPMIFGKDNEKAIVLRGFTPQVVRVEDVDPGEILVHDASSKALASLLASMEFPEFPAMLGVFRQVDRPDYVSQLMGQVEQAQAEKGKGDLNALYRAADLWTVSERATPEADVAGTLSASLDEEYIDELDGAPVTNGSGPLQDRLIGTSIAALAPNVPITADAHSSLAQAIRHMNLHNIGCLLVTDAEDKLIGVFTERDVLMRVAGLIDDLSVAPIGDYMTSDPIAAQEDLPIAHALHIMSVHGFRHLPIVDEEGRPTGIISFRDVVEFLNREIEKLGD